MRRLRIAVTVALGVAVVAPSPVSAAPQAVPETKPIYSYKEAIRETVYVEAPMDSDRDGKPDRIAVLIMRPKETATGLKTPVIVEPSPYYAEFAHGCELADRQARVGFCGWYDEFFVPRGYTVIEAEMQGTSRSSGCPMHGGAEDTTSIKAVVDWLNGRAKAYYANGSAAVASWSTGAVGMVGVSYNGTLPNAVAATGVEELKTIVPIAAISSWYDFSRDAGIGYSIHPKRYPEYLARSVISKAAGAKCAPVLKALGDNAGDDTYDYTPFWAERNYRPDVGKVKASVLLVHGMEDWTVKPGQGVRWWDLLQKQGVPRKIWLHRSGHVDPVELRSREWKRQLHRWMDHWLFGMDNGIMKEPMADIQRPNGTWETHRSWPDAAASTVRMTFGPAGSGVAGTLGERPTTGTQSFTDKRTQSEKTAMADYTVPAPNRLVYVTKPVTQDVRMSGTPRVNVTVQSDSVSAPLTALLVDYGPGMEYPVVDYSPMEIMKRKCDLVDVDQGTCAAPQADHALPVTAKVITRGAIDLKNRSSVAAGSPLVPGQKYQASWELQGKDYVVPAGHRIGLVLMANNRMYIEVDKSANALTVQLGDSSLDLPVVGGKI